MIGFWTVGPFDYNLTQMDNYPAVSCAISPMAFLLNMKTNYLQKAVGFELRVAATSQISSLIALPTVPLGN